MTFSMRKRQKKKERSGRKVDRQLFQLKGKTYYRTLHRQVNKAVALPGSCVGFVCEHTIGQFLFSIAEAAKKKKARSRSVEPVGRRGDKFRDHGKKRSFFFFFFVVLKARKWTAGACYQSGCDGRHGMARGPCTAQMDTRVSTEDLLMMTGSTGTSLRSVFVFSTLRITSRPSITFPKTT